MLILQANLTCQIGFFRQLKRKDSPPWYCSLEDYPYYLPTLDFIAPITAGTTDIKIIKINTTEKLSLIIGIFPKK